MSGNRGHKAFGHFYRSKRVTEKTQGNPLEPANYATGGGLWDGKTVTITSAKTVIDRITYGDGTPWLDDQGNPGTNNALQITGIADDEETERRQTYSMGGLVPTNDGEGFVRPDGTPGQLHKNSGLAKFNTAIKNGGFDLGQLWDAESQRTRYSNLVGARFTFKAELRLDKSGKVKKNKKGYDQNDFYPVKFVGFRAGAAATPKGNGAELKSKATAAVIAALTSAPNNTLTRAELVRALASQGADVVSLVVQPSFHEGQSWRFSGTTLSL